MASRLARWLGACGTLGSVFLILVIAASWPAWAGEAPKPASTPNAPPATPAAAPVPTPPVAPAKPDAAEVEEKDRSLREQSIYIPYEKLRKTFEKEGRGVFLPYEKYRELWQAAQDKRARAAEPKPPVGALITEIDSEAVVGKDVVRVKATAKIEVLAEGWSEVPLRLSDAAITESTLGGQPARIVAAGGDAGYKLLVEKKGKKPEQVELVLQYAKAITRAPGQNSVAIQAPQAPVNRWRVRIPEAGVKVNLQPVIAAPEVVVPPPAKKPDAKAASQPEETVVTAFVGAAPTVRIEWTPKAEGATGLEALVSVQTEQQVNVGEGVSRARAQMVFAISRSELRQLVIEVPADQKVVNVFDANVRQWSVEQAGPVQKITAQLFEPAKATQNVTVELEKYSEEKASGKFLVPVVKAAGAGVGRQQGVVVVRLSEGLRGEVARSSGVLQVDAAELPPNLAKGQWPFAYRYAAVPFELELNVEKVQPRVLVDSLVEAELQPERLTVDLLAVYTIERAGVFRLELDVPAGFEVRQVRGKAAAGAGEVAVDSHHLEGKDKTRLVVNLTRKAFGRVALAVQLQRDLKEPDLLTPTGKAVQVALPVPKVATEGVERATGRLMVYAPESLRVNPGKIEGLRSISLQEALEGMQSSRQGRSSDARPVLAFAFTQEPTTCLLAAERRKPQVTIRQFLVARVEEGVVQYRATFFYNVLYSGVKSLRIDVPEKIAGQLRNLTPAIRDKTLDPQPADVAKGYVAWSFTGQTELLGNGQIELAWQTNIPKLDVGGSVALEVPRLKPMGVDRAWGQIVLVKAETIDVQDDPKSEQGLRPIDPQHDLMPGAGVSNAALAFEFHDDWSLVAKATRYQLEEVKHTSIERALLRMVVTRANKITVQALYRMRSAQQRLAVRLPEGAKIDVQPRISGKPITLEVGQEREFFIPLVGQNPEESFLLEMRYTVPGDGRRLEYPDFGGGSDKSGGESDAAAVQQVFVAVYLPQELALLGSEGPWTEEFSWDLDPWGRWRPWPKMNESQLLAWVSGGRIADESDKFPTDGRMVLFSALRPLAPEEGALELHTVKGNWLHGLVFAVVVLGGVLLWPARSANRAAAIGALVIALVLCGVFVPTFSHQVLNGVLAAAVAVVAVVWLVAAWRHRPARPAAASACAAPPAPTPPPPPPEAPAGNPPASDSQEGE